LRNQQKTHLEMNQKTSTIFRHLYKIS
jgi:hypothetical protein